jgi:hypothetical protein
MHQFLKFIYFELTLYMFRTVFPSIVRSSRLHIQQRAYVADFVILYCSICFVQVSFGVSILVCFFCLFDIDKFDVHRSVHRNIFL